MFSLSSTPPCPARSVLPAAGCMWVAIMAIMFMLWFNSWPSIVISCAAFPNLYVSACAHTSIKIAKATAPTRGVYK
eukprot:1583993-Amphidinium_carterae.1